MIEVTVLSRPPSRPPSSAFCGVPAPTAVTGAVAGAVGELSEQESATKALKTSTEERTNLERIIVRPGEGFKRVRLGEHVTWSDESYGTPLRQRLCRALTAFSTKTYKTRSSKLINNGVTIFYTRI